jgi:hypothetical protein
MRRAYGLATALLAALPGPAGAQAPPMPSFPVETVHSEGVREIELVISRAGWHLMGRTPAGYRIGTGAPAGMTGKAAAALQACNTTALEGHGALERTIPADAYAGGRVRVTGRIKMRSAAYSLFYVNLIGRGGQTLRQVSLQNGSGEDWQVQAIVVDVRDNVSAMDIGVTLSSTSHGTVWLDSVTLEAVDQTVALKGHVASGGYERDLYDQVVSCDGDKDGIRE